MRKLFWQMNVTLDGFIEGPSGELDYTAHVADADFDRYVSDMLRSIDAMVLGPRTYQFLIRYWPTATGADADAMNALTKIVCSRTLDSVEWNNSRLLKGDAVAEIAALKNATRQRHRALWQC